MLISPADTIVIEARRRAAISEVARSRVIAQARDGDRTRALGPRPSASRFHRLYSVVAPIIRRRQPARLG